MAKFLLGAATTLVVGILVTVIGTAITRQKERLVYTIDQPVAFETETTHLTIQTVTIANIGDASAKDVEVVIDASRTGTDIKDQSVVSSSGAASGILIQDHMPKDVSLSLNSLIPNEQIKVSLLLSAKPKEVPTVSVKSDATLGTLQPSLGDANKHTMDALINFLRGASIALAGVIAAFASYEWVAHRKTRNVIKSE